MILQRVVVHQDLFADVPRDDGHTASTGDDSLQVFPTSSNASTVPLEHLLQGHRHFLFKDGGGVDVSRDAEQLGPVVSLPTKAGEPFTRSTSDGCEGRKGGRGMSTRYFQQRQMRRAGRLTRGNGDGLDVGDGGRASEQLYASGTHQHQRRWTTPLLCRSGMPELTPTSAGKGGLSLGFPCFPSIDSISAVSSPQI